MTTCPKCGTRINNRTVTVEDESQSGSEFVLTDLVKAEVESLTKQRQLVEAALGTLSMVAKSGEVPELQAAKIRAAIDVLITSTTL